MPDIDAVSLSSVDTLQKQSDESSASFLRAARAGNLPELLDLLKAGTNINTCNANGLNALHIASKEGHADVVAELLARGADVDASTKKGNTALHIASLAGQLPVVTLLVEHNANVNVQSQDGFTPLYMAAQENHDKVVTFLLQHDANQSLATEEGFTPLAVALQQGHDRVVAILLENDTRGRVRLPALHIAAKKDDTKAAALLLQSDHNPDVTSKSGFTPLHIAAHYGNENMAKLLLEKGANVNFLARHNITPLHVASKWGRANLVSLLLAHGAVIDCRTKDLLTPLHCAARSGHEQIVDLLLEKGAPISAKSKNGLAPLHNAAQGDHADTARILLYHRAPVDEVTVDYLTALHIAAHYGHVRTAKLLLDRNADPNARALNGFTPLHVACKKNRIKVVELLLKYQAALQATTESGLTPLHVAAFMGCMNIVVYLIQHGARPDDTTVHGETPLHLAARAYQTDVVRILLRNGATVDAAAREGQTPLHIASRLGNTDIVMLLLQHGAKVDATARDNYTPLHVAAKEGHEDVVTILLDHNASCDLKTGKGYLPIHLASKYGNLSVVQALLEKGAEVDAEGKNQVTPLHVAAHYNHQQVALQLLEHNASPLAAAKNGFTPLHIVAKKNQMDIAPVLLEYHADVDAESKAGFTPLHLASENGHVEMAAFLIENGSNVNAQAKNGLTPMHMCAQNDHVEVAQLLKDSGAELNSQTKSGYTPLHVACHFGQINMVRFLLENGADLNIATLLGYTPLHQAAQQGHGIIVKMLIDYGASPNALTSTGQTPLAIAQKLGYVSVVETLRTVTETTIITETTTITEERYKVQSPETMQETFISESEDEGDETLNTNELDNLLNRGALSTLSNLHVNSGTLLMDTATSGQLAYSPSAISSDFDGGLLKRRATGDGIAHLRYTDDAAMVGSTSFENEIHRNIDLQEDLLPMDKSMEAEQLQLENLIKKVQQQPFTPSSTDYGFDIHLAADNIDVVRSALHSGKLMTWKSFLVSFLVDARGGAMRGCRHSGVRVIIPPRKAPMPMRITCRYLRREKLIHPPPLNEGEALASRILEMGPAGAKFLGPVIIEVPHFASLRGREREIVILRSENGEHWKEHSLEATEDAVQEVLNESFDPEELSQLDDLNTTRITRILSSDFPQYFALVTRIRQEVHAVGPEGGMIASTVVPQVQALFPEGALTKTIKVSLQAHGIPQDLVTKLHGNRVAVSPIVTVEPRRRKFHKPITLCIPLPQSTNKGMITQYSAQTGQDPPTLRLLCSITGGTAAAKWEDITGTTQLTFSNDNVSFTTTVSARFWLMDCQTPRESARMAQEIYNEGIVVPYMAKFIVFARRPHPNEGQLRLFCVTDDKEDKTLERQEHYKEIAKSRDVEVLASRFQHLEFAGNLIPVTKSGEQLSLRFIPFQENRLMFLMKLRDFDDPDAAAAGRLAIMREPKQRAEALPPQHPICTLAITLPAYSATSGSDTLIAQHEQKVLQLAEAVEKPNLYTASRDSETMYNGVAFRRIEVPVSYANVEQHTSGVMKPKIDQSRVVEEEIVISPTRFEKISSAEQPQRQLRKLSDHLEEVTGVGFAQSPPLSEIAVVQVKEPVAVDAAAPPVIDDLSGIDGRPITHMPDSLGSSVGSSEQSDDTIICRPEADDTDAVTRGDRLLYDEQPAISLPPKDLRLDLKGNQSFEETNVHSVSEPYPIRVLLGGRKPDDRLSAESETTSTYESCAAEPMTVDKLAYDRGSSGLSPLQAEEWVSVATSQSSSPTTALLSDREPFSRAEITSDINLPYQTTTASLIVDDVQQRQRQTLLAESLPTKREPERMSKTKSDEISVSSAALLAYRDDGIEHELDFKEPVSYLDQYASYEENVRKASSDVKAPTISKRASLPREEKLLFKDSNLEDLETVDPNLSYMEQYHKYESTVARDSSREPVTQQLPVAAAEATGSLFYKDSCLEEVDHVEPGVSYLEQYKQHEARTTAAVRQLEPSSSLTYEDSDLQEPDHGDTSASNLEHSEQLKLESTRQYSVTKLKPILSEGGTLPITEGTLVYEGSFEEGKQEELEKPNEQLIASLSSLKESDSCQKPGTDSPHAETSRLSREIMTTTGPLIYHETSLEPVLQTDPNLSYLEEYHQYESSLKEKTSPSLLSEEKTTSSSAQKLTQDTGGFLVYQDSSYVEPLQQIDPNLSYLEEYNQHEKSLKKAGPFQRVMSGGGMTKKSTSFSSEADVPGSLTYRDDSLEPVERIEPIVSYLEEYRQHEVVCDKPESPPFSSLTDKSPSSAENENALITPLVYRESCLEATEEPPDLSESYLDQYHQYEQSLKGDPFVKAVAKRMPIHSGEREIPGSLTYWDDSLEPVDQTEPAVSYLEEYHKHESMGAKTVHRPSASSNEQDVLPTDQLVYQESCCLEATENQPDLSVSYLEQYHQFEKSLKGGVPVMSAFAKKSPSLSSECEVPGSLIYQESSVEPVDRTEPMVSSYLDEYRLYEDAAKQVPVLATSSNIQRSLVEEDAVHTGPLFYQESFLEPVEHQQHDQKMSILEQYDNYELSLKPASETTARVVTERTASLNEKDAKIGPLSYKESSLEPVDVSCSALGYHVSQDDESQDSLKKDVRMGDVIVAAAGKLPSSGEIAHLTYEENECLQPIEIADPNVSYLEQYQEYETSNKKVTPATAEVGKLSSFDKDVVAAGLLTFEENGLEPMVQMDPTVSYLVEYEQFEKNLKGGGRSAESAFVKSPSVEREIVLAEPLSYRYSSLEQVDSAEPNVSYLEQYREYEKSLKKKDIPFVSTFAQSASFGQGVPSSPSSSLTYHDSGLDESERCFAEGDEPALERYEKEVETHSVVKPSDSVDDTAQSRSLFYKEDGGLQDVDNFDPHVSYLEQYRQYESSMMASRAGPDHAARTQLSVTAPSASLVYTESTLVEPDQTSSTVVNIRQYQQKHDLLPEELDKFPTKLMDTSIQTTKPFSSALTYSDPGVEETADTDMALSYLKQYDEHEASLKKDDDVILQRAAAEDKFDSTSSALIYKDSGLEKAVEPVEGDVSYLELYEQHEANLKKKGSDGVAQLHGEHVIPVDALVYNDSGLEEVVADQNVSYLDQYQQEVPSGKKSSSIKVLLDLWNTTTKAVSSGYSSAGQADAEAKLPASSDVLLSKTAESSVEEMIPSSSCLTYKLDSSLDETENVDPGTSYMEQYHQYETSLKKAGTGGSAVAPTKSPPVSREMATSSSLISYQESNFEKSNLTEDVKPFVADSLSPRVIVVEEDSPGGGDVSLSYTPSSLDEVTEGVVSMEPSVSSAITDRRVSYETVPVCQPQQTAAIVLDKPGELIYRDSGMNEFEDDNGDASDGHRSSTQVVRRVVHFVEPGGRCRGDSNLPDLISTHSDVWIQEGGRLLENVNEVTLNVEVRRGQDSGEFVITMPERKPLPWEMEPLKPEHQAVQDKDQDEENRVSSAEKERIEHLNASVGDTAQHGQSSLHEPCAAAVEICHDSEQQSSHLIQQQPLEEKSCPPMPNFELIITSSPLLRASISEPLLERSPEFFVPASAVRHFEAEYWSGEHDERGWSSSEDDDLDDLEQSSSGDGGKFQLLVASSEMDDDGHEQQLPYVHRCTPYGAVVQGLFNGWPVLGELTAQLRDHDSGRFVEPGFCEKLYQAEHWSGQHGDLLSDDEPRDVVDQQRTIVVQQGLFAGVPVIHCCLPTVSLSNFIDTEDYSRKTDVETSQETETLEEGYVEEGHLVSTKKIMRVVTTTRTLSEGPDGKPIQKTVTTTQTFGDTATGEPIVEEISSSPENLYAAGPVGLVSQCRVMFEKKLPSSASMLHQLPLDLPEMSPVEDNPPQVSQPSRELVGTSPSEERSPLSEEGQFSERVEQEQQGSEEDAVSVRDRIKHFEQWDVEMQRKKFGLPERVGSTMMRVSQSSTVKGADARLPQQQNLDGHILLAARVVEDQIRQSFPSEIHLVESAPVSGSVSHCCELLTVQKPELPDTETLRDLSTKPTSTNASPDLPVSFADQQLYVPDVGEQMPSLIAADEKPQTAELHFESNAAALSEITVDQPSDVGRDGRADWEQQLLRVVAENEAIAQVQQARGGRMQVQTEPLNQQEGSKHVAADTDELLTRSDSLSSAEQVLKLFGLDEQRACIEQSQWRTASTLQEATESQFSPVSVRAEQQFDQLEENASTEIEQFEKDTRDEEEEVHKQSEQERYTSALGEMVESAAAAESERAVYKVDDVVAPSLDNLKATAISSVDDTVKSVHQETGKMTAADDDELEIRYCTELYDLCEQVDAVPVESFVEHRLLDYQRASLELIPEAHAQKTEEWTAEAGLPVLEPEVAFQEPPPTAQAFQTEDHRTVIVMTPSLGEEANELSVTGSAVQQPDDEEKHHVRVEQCSFVVLATEDVPVTECTDQVQHEWTNSIVSDQPTSVVCKSEIVDVEDKLRTSSCGQDFTKLTDLQKMEITDGEHDVPLVAVVQEDHGDVSYSEVELEKKSAESVVGECDGEQQSQTDQQLTRPGIASEDVQSAQLLSTFAHDTEKLVESPDGLTDSKAMELILEPGDNVQTSDTAKSWIYSKLMKSKHEDSLDLIFASVEAVDDAEIEMKDKFIEKKEEQEQEEEEEQITATPQIAEQAALDESYLIYSNVGVISGLQQQHRRVATQLQCGNLVPVYSYCNVIDGLFRPMNAGQQSVGVESKIDAATEQSDEARGLGDSAVGKMDAESSAPTSVTCYDDDSRAAYVSSRRDELLTDEDRPVDDDDEETVFCEVPPVSRQFFEEARDRRQIPGHLITDSAILLHRIHDISEGMLSPDEHFAPAVLMERTFMLSPIEGSPITPTAAGEGVSPFDHGHDHKTIIKEDDESAALVGGSPMSTGSDEDSSRLAAESDDQAQGIYETCKIGASQSGDYRTAEASPTLTERSWRGSLLAEEEEEEQEDNDAKQKEKFDVGAPASATLVIDDDAPARSGASDMELYVQRSYFQRIGSGGSLSPEPGADAELVVDSEPFSPEPTDGVEFSAVDQLQSSAVAVEPEDYEHHPEPETALAAAVEVLESKKHDDQSLLVSTTTFKSDDNYVETVTTSARPISVEFYKDTTVSSYVEQSDDADVETAFVRAVGHSHRGSQDTVRSVHETVINEPADLAEYGITSAIPVDSNRPQTSAPLQLDEPSREVKFTQKMKGMFSGMFSGLSSKKVAVVEAVQQRSESAEQISRSIVALDESGASVPIDEHIQSLIRVHSDGLLTMLEQRSQEEAPKRHASSTLSVEQISAERSSLAGPLMHSSADVAHVEQATEHSGKAPSDVAVSALTKAELASSFGSQISITESGWMKTTYRVVVGSRKSSGVDSGADNDDAQQLDDVSLKHGSLPSLSGGEEQIPEEVQLSKLDFLSTQEEPSNDEAVVTVPAPEICVTRASLISGSPDIDDIYVCDTEVSDAFLDNFVERPAEIDLPEICQSPGEESSSRIIHFNEHLEPSSLEVDSFEFSADTVSASSTDVVPAVELEPALAEQLVDDVLAEAFAISHLASAEHGSGIPLGSLSTSDEQQQQADKHSTYDNEDKLLSTPSDVEHFSIPEELSSLCMTDQTGFVESTDCEQQRMQADEHEVLLPKEEAAAAAADPRDSTLSALSQFVEFERVTRAVISDIGLEESFVDKQAQPLAEEEQSSSDPLPLEEVCQQPAVDASTAGSGDTSLVQPVPPPHDSSLEEEGNLQNHLVEKAILNSLPFYSYADVHADALPDVEGGISTDSTQKESNASTLPGESAFERVAHLNLNAAADESKPEQRPEAERAEHEADDEEHFEALSETDTPMSSALLVGACAVSYPAEDSSGSNVESAAAVSVLFSEVHEQCSTALSDHADKLDTADAAVATQSVSATDLSVKEQDEGIEEGGGVLSQIARDEHSCVSSKTVCEGGVPSAEMVAPEELITKQRGIRDDHLFSNGQQPQLELAVADEAVTDRPTESQSTVLLKQAEEKDKNADEICTLSAHTDNAAALITEVLKVAVEELREAAEHALNIEAVCAEGVSSEMLSTGEELSRSESFTGTEEDQEISAIKQAHEPALFEQHHEDYDDKSATDAEKECAFYTGHTAVDLAVSSALATAAEKPMNSDFSVQSAEFQVHTGATDRTDDSDAQQHCKKTIEANENLSLTDDMEGGVVNAGDSNFVSEVDSSAVCDAAVNVGSNAFVSLRYDGGSGLDEDSVSAARLTFTTDGTARATDMESSQFSSDSLVDQEQKQVPYSFSPCVDDISEGKTIDLNLTIQNLDQADDFSCKSVVDDDEAPIGWHDFSNEKHESSSAITGNEDDIQCRLVVVPQQDAVAGELLSISTEEAGAGAANASTSSVHSFADTGNLVNTGDVTDSVCKVAQNGHSELPVASPICENAEVGKTPIQDELNVQTEGDEPEIRCAEQFVIDETEGSSDAQTLVHESDRLVSVVHHELIERQTSSEAVVLQHSSGEEHSDAVQSAREEDECDKEWVFVESPDENVELETETELVEAKVGSPYPVWETPIECLKWSGDQIREIPPEQVVQVEQSPSDESEIVSDQPVLASVNSSIQMSSPEEVDEVEPACLDSEIVYTLDDGLRAEVDSEQQQSTCSVPVRPDDLLLSSVCSEDSIEAVAPFVAEKNHEMEEEQSQESPVKSEEQSPEMELRTVAEAEVSEEEAVGSPGKRPATVRSSKHSSMDNVSDTSSLLEFERFERELMNIKMGDSSVSSSETEALNLPLANKRSSNGSVSSLAEFERLERECEESGAQLTMMGTSEKCAQGTQAEGAGESSLMMTLSDIKEESDSEDVQSVSEPERDSLATVVEQQVDSGRTTPTVGEQQQQQHEQSTFTTSMDSLEGFAMGMSKQQAQAQEMSLSQSDSLEPEQDSNLLQSGPKIIPELMFSSDKDSLIASTVSEMSTDDTDNADGLQEHTGEGRALLSCDTIGTFQEYGDEELLAERDSLCGDLEESTIVVDEQHQQPDADPDTPVDERRSFVTDCFSGSRSFGGTAVDSGSAVGAGGGGDGDFVTSLTRFETRRPLVDGSYEVITRTVSTREMDPVNSRIRFTGSESIESLTNALLSRSGSFEQFTSTDEQGNVTTTVVRRVSGGPLIDNWRAGELDETGSRSSIQSGVRSSESEWVWQDSGPNTTLVMRREHAALALQHHAYYQQQQQQQQQLEQHPQLQQQQSSGVTGARLERKLSDQSPDSDGSVQSLQGGWRCVTLVQVKYVVTFIYNMQLGYYIWNDCRFALYQGVDYLLFLSFFIFCLVASNKFIFHIFVLKNHLVIRCFFGWLQLALLKTDEFARGYITDCFLRHFRESHHEHLLQCLFLYTSSWVCACLCVCVLVNNVRFECVISPLRIVYSMVPLLPSKMFFALQTTIHF
ncbi:Ankyrin-2, partial [Trichinella zimbabwensis]